MRWNIRRVLVLSAVVGAAGVPPAPAQQAPAPVPQPKQDDAVEPAQAAADPAAARVAPTGDPARMAKLLRLWEEQSARLKTLDVEIDRTDKNPAWGEDEHYVGRALLMSPDLAWLDFKKVAFRDGKPVADKNGNLVAAPYERIISTGEEVWQYRSDTKQIFIYPLEKQPQKRALEEGPLPFLFNFREAEARGRYEMALMSRPEEEVDHYWIGIRPKLTMDQDAFSMAYVKLDKQLRLPVRIYLLAPDGKSSKNFVLKNIKPNAPIMADNFKGRVIDTWKLVDNRGGNQDGQGQAPPKPAASAAPTAGRPARPSAPAQPALRPGIFGGRRD